MKDDVDRLETIGMLIVEWSRIETEFPRGIEGGGADLDAVAKKSRISRGQLDLVRRVRNRGAHGADSVSLDELDEALGVLHLVWRSLDGGAGEVSEPQPSLPPVASDDGSDPPSTYPNPRGDNAWDNDAVHWLLEQPGVAESFKRGPLMECLRCQPARVRGQPDRVEAAAALARQFGVIQRQEFDEKLSKRVVRLYRTDPGRPRYPGNPPDAAI